MKISGRGLPSCLGRFNCLKRDKPALLPEFLPEKDVPIFLAAIEARATHLVTGDVRHFRAYFGKKIQGIAILRPGDYLRMVAR